MVPEFLGDVFEKRISAIRENAGEMYDDYWKTVTDFVIRPCYECGRRCRVETENAGDIYSPSCRRCSIESFARTGADDLAERMSVC